MKLSIKLSIIFVVATLGVLLYQAFVSNREVKNDKLMHTATTPEKLHTVLADKPGSYNLSPLSSFSSIHIDGPVSLYILKGSRNELFIRKSHKKGLISEVKDGVLTIRMTDSEKKTYRSTHTQTFLFMPQAPESVSFAGTSNNFQTPNCYVYGFDNQPVFFKSSASFGLRLNTDLQQIRIFQGKEASRDFHVLSGTMDPSKKIPRVDINAEIHFNNFVYDNKAAQRLSLNLEIENGLFSIDSPDSKSTAEKIQIQGTLNKKNNQGYHELSESRINLKQSDSLILNLKSNMQIDLFLDKNMKTGYQDIQCDSLILLGKK